MEPVESWHPFTGEEVEIRLQRLTDGLSRSLDVGIRDAIDETHEDSLVDVLHAPDRFATDKTSVGAVDKPQAMER